MKLYIFDLDGTLVDDMGFYKKAYSDNLDALIKSRRGNRGVEVLNFVRQSNGGRGELALAALGIPYSEWFDAITEDDISLITPKPKLVEIIENIEGNKVVFTGSSKMLAEKMLVRIGFTADSFTEIVAFEKPATIPVKLATDTIVFEYLLNKYEATPNSTYSIGDDYETDLFPAEILGIHAIEVRHKSGRSKHFILNILDLPHYLKKNFK